MPVLPIIDLLIFLGWTTLFAGGLLKAIYIATAYRPTVFTLAPSDLLLLALGFLALAVTLAARTWVRLNEPRLIADRRAAASRHAPSWAADHDPVAAAMPIGEPSHAAAEPGSQPQWQRVP